MFTVTITGVEVDLDAPTPEMINIVDIAFSLARQRRFNGHTVANCTIALHSVIVSHIVPPEYAKYGLLHDAHEAYTGDITTPIKCDCTRELEQRLDSVIWQRFNLPSPNNRVTETIKRADLSALLTEKIHFMPDTLSDWGCFEGVQPAIVNDELWDYYDIYDPEFHQLLFTKRLDELWR